MTSVSFFKAKHLFRFANINIDVNTETYSFAFYFAYLIKQRPFCFAAEDFAGNMQGYLICKKEGGQLAYGNAALGYRRGLPPSLDSLHGHVSALTVDKHCRRQGIGQLLMRYYEDASNAVHCYFIDLFVRKSNDVAIKMYEKMGYSIYRVIENYYIDTDPANPYEDAYDMRKPLLSDVDKKSLLPL